MHCARCVVAVFARRSLHGAIRTKQDQAARVLLECKAAVDDASATLDTPLLLAVDSGHMPSVRLLLSHRADVEATNTSGQFPLLLAVHRSDLSAIDALVEVRSVDVENALCAFC
jgi:ankyrin repeat protein